jgi:bacterioferritin
MYLTGMGQLGKNFVKNRQKIIQELIRAYADEWFAHYNYAFTGWTLRGHHSPSTISLLERKSKDAFQRTARLAERILELGGQPVTKLTDLPQSASPKPFKLPKSLSDVDGVLKAVLDAERTSLRTYRDLQALCAEEDPVTELLVRGYYADTAKGEEELERLIGDAAPEMRGG